MCLTSNPENDDYSDCMWHLDPGGNIISSRSMPGGSGDLITIRKKSTNLKLVRLKCFRSVYLLYLVPLCSTL